MFDNGQITYYVNGVQTSAQSLSGSNVRLDVTRIGAWNTSRYYTGLLDDWALWADPLTAGQATAIFDLGDQLGYDQGQVQDLFELFDETVDSVMIAGTTWYRASDLVGGLGLTDQGTHLELVLDSYGRGLTTQSSVIPEPMTMLAIGLGISGLGGYIRRRRRA